MTFVLRWIVTTIAVTVALYLVPGIVLPTDQDAFISITIFSMFLALVNMGIKPVLKFLTLPVTVLTLGLFMFVLNAFMVYLAAWLTTNLFLIDIQVTSFMTAILFSIVVSVISALVNFMMGVEDMKH